MLTRLPCLPRITSRYWHKCSSSKSFNFCALPRIAIELGVSGSPLVPHTSPGCSFAKKVRAHRRLSCLLAILHPDLGYRVPISMAFILKIHSANQQQFSVHQLTALPRGESATPPILQRVLNAPNLLYSALLSIILYSFYYFILSYL